MGCNCGKNRKPPYGVKPKKDVQKPKVVKAKGDTQTFTLTTPDRRVQTFGSRLEAKAALVRAGGVGTIRSE